jgi:hypothetical protein
MLLLRRIDVTSKGYPGSLPYDKLQIHEVKYIGENKARDPGQPRAKGEVERGYMMHARVLL